MTIVAKTGKDMEKLIKILLLIIIFTAGCNGHTDNLVKRESKVNSILTKDINNNGYTIKRASNGVYIYTDMPKSENSNNLYGINNEIINN